MFFARMIGESDGEWSEQEMRQALLKGNLSAALNEAPDWADKIRSGELNYQSAIYLLNNESREIQMDCLVTCFLIGAVDGIFEESEGKVLINIISNLNKNIKLKDVTDAALKLYK